eukprot:195008-Amphidinium_carterae.1
MEANSLLSARQEPWPQSDEQNTDFPKLHRSGLSQGLGCGRIGCPSAAISSTVQGLPIMWLRRRATVAPA